MIYLMSTINFYNSYLVTVADQASEREQESDEAEREVLDMKMAEYMESHVGETYIGVVSIRLLNLACLLILT
jgi:ribonuclease R